MTATYNEIPNLIRQRKDFEGNSMSGNSKEPGGYGVHKGRGDMDVPPEADYVIWSYGTPIGYAIEETLFVTTEKFSHTSSRHQSVLRQLGARRVNPFAKIVDAPSAWADEIEQMEER